MKFIITISVLTLTTAVRIPNTWQLNNAVDFKNLFDTKPVHENQNIVSLPPRSPTININSYRNTIPNGGTRNLPYSNKKLSNVPGNNNWVPLIPSNNDYTFLTPKITAGSILNPDFLNNLFSPQLASEDGSRKKSYNQQTQIPPKFTVISGKNMDRKTTNPGLVLNKDLPEENQVQYITYTTQASGTQGSEFSTIQPTQIVTRTANPKQTYPQKGAQNNAPQLPGIDFSLKNPFPKNHQSNKLVQKPIPQQAYTAQPAVNFDFNFNNPVNQNHPTVKIINNQQNAPTPILPQPTIQKNLNLISPHNSNIRLSTQQPLTNLDFDPNHPFNKNYRDDRTHEPIPYDPYYDQERIPKVERLEHEKAPVSNHELLSDIPVRPIYPGAGQWAKPGAKHRPFISQHKYVPLEESRTVPDGYDTFLEAQKLFEDQTNQFGQKLKKLPETHQLGSFTSPVQRANNVKTVNGNNPGRAYYQQQKPNLNEQSNTEEEEEEIFVPSKLYAQVRHTEDEQHLPPAADEHGRLKELVKDSKIQTVYSEEGYEDSGYDHAGHEKNAENAEDFEKDEKEVLKKDQKNEPSKKFNLHLPKHESISYTKGDINLKEEDIQKLKEEVLNLDTEDSETAGSQYEKSYIDKTKPPKKVYSARTKGFKKPKVTSKDQINFSEDENTKSLATIVKGDGNTEMEISSEVKVIVQPNNSTKSHKYVKIYPKTYKTMNSENVLKRNKSVFDNTTESPFTTLTPTEFTEIYTMEIPSTTQATTAIPKLKNSLKTNRKRRQKRFVNDFPKIDVDTDFIDGISHELGKPTRKPDLTKIKYPYYNNYKEIGLHENSPLRYSEDLKNVPFKVEGKLAFYDQADKRRECADVNPHVDPVPERIKEADENPEEVEDATDVEELVKSPRLGKLGDKIDCFKEKYFGENPLDNPIFQEELVGPVKPIFKEIESITTEKTVVKHDNIGSRPKNLNYRTAKREPIINRNSLLENEPKKSASDYNDENEIEDDVLEKVYEKFVKSSLHPTFYEKFGKEERNLQDKKDTTESEDDNKSVNNKQGNDNPKTEKNKKNPKDDVETIDVNNKDTVKESQRVVYTPPTPILMTTPKYTIALKPKHIYDQIKLLHYLPVEDYLDMTGKSVEKSTEKPIKKLTEKPTEKPTQRTTKKPTTRPAKTVERTVAPKRKVKVDKPKIHKNRKPKNNTLINTANNGKAESISSNANRESSAENISEREPKAFNSDKEKIKSRNSDESNAESLPAPDALQRRRRTKMKPKKPQYEIFDINQYLPKVPYPTPPHTNIIATPRQRISIQSAIPKAPEYQVFDINKFLPTTPFPLFSQSTVLPKYKVVSEVFYKDDIKPNEQFNVFTDVINNIKNFPQGQQDIFSAPSEPISVKVKKTTYNRVKGSYVRDDEDLEENKNFDVLITSTTTEPSTYRSQYKNHRARYSTKETENQVTENIKPSYKANSNTNRRHQITTTTSKPNSSRRSQYNLYKNHQNSENISQGEGKDRTMSRHTTNNTIKRRRRIKTTTTTEPVLTESLSTDEELSTEVMGLVPPGPNRYKTITQHYNPKHEPYFVGDDTEEERINKFLVLGMKPPPRQKVYSYSDFLTVNHIQQRRDKLKRGKRSADRPAYAEVNRNGGRQGVTEKTDTKADDDDYVPHRSKNYHYDEKTGKIVYDKKPKEQEEESEEEVEYIEVVEEIPSTTAKPKQNPIFATATPPPKGQSYVDFVKLLKSSSNYHEIPDPTTTEKGKEETTESVASSTTLKVASTSPPEFLSILAKVRNDGNYKVIEDKKKTKATTTTESPEAEEIVEADEEESQVQNVRNSPGAPGVLHGENFKLFDITDFLPKVKSYFPKTSIDTTKYKSIQRSSGRNNSTSRNNSGEESRLQNIDRNKKITLDTESTQYETKDTIAEIATKSTASTTSTTTPSTIKRTTITTTTTTAAPETVTPKIMRTHNRKRTTTLRSIGTTQEITTASPSTTTDAETVHNGKVRRNYRRRNPRVKTTTTEKFLNEDVDDTTKIVRRRSETDTSILPAGYENNEQLLLRYYVDEPELLVATDNVENEKADTIPKTLPSTENTNETDSGEIVKRVVEILKNYDQTKKHGGNYKNENEFKAEVNSLEQAQDNKSPSTENQDQAGVQTVSNTNKNGDVDIFKIYDKTKKHGGNYRSEDELATENKNSSLKVTEAIKVNNEVSLKRYEETEIQKPDGEDKPQDIHVQKDGGQVNGNVEIFKNYDKTKKHGGNYRSEDDEAAQINEQQSEESSYGPPKDNQKESNIPEIRRTNDIEILKKTYDKNKKHGGNYRSEDEVIVNDKNQPAINVSNIQSNTNKAISQNIKIKDIEIFNNYDKNKKHGGNYKYENEDGVKEPKIEETQYTKPKPHDKKVHNENKNNKNLVDAITKPESFYSDPKLPVVINDLKIVDELSSDEIEDIVSSAEQDHFEEISEVGNESAEKENQDVSVRTFSDNVKTTDENTQATTTKKPLFIKDPSKRLYYYAPVR